LGVWAKLLQLNDINVHHIDDYSDVYFRYGISTLTDVEKIEAVDAIKKYQNYDVLMFAWINRYWCKAHEVADLFKGNKIVYVGEYYPNEPIGPGNLMLSEALDENFRNNYNLIESFDLEPWRGTSDKLCLFERK
jgi:hypothetical protein